MPADVVRALSIETSGRRGSVALSEDGHVVAEDSFAHGLQHAAGLLPMIDTLVRSRGWTPADLTHVYVSIGPGSFTGLRIAVTLAKTLAMATSAKIVAVPTARILIENLPADAREAVVVLDAKRGQIFTARYIRDSAGLWTETEPAHLDTLAAMLLRAGRPVHLVGEGIPYHREAIIESPDVRVADESLWQAQATVVARLGREMARRGELADPWTLTPLYVRLPEAEEKRLAAEAAT